MAFNLDSALGVHANAVLIRAKRAQILAKNIANADTPGFKARDISFRETLKSADSNTTHAQIAKTNTKHLGRQSSPLQFDLKYRTPLQPSLDGNTVDTQMEISQFTQNAMRYQASLQFLNGNIRSVMTALRGD